MDQNERMRLKKQYEQYADTQILSMLEDGPDAFVDGAYALLEEEAKLRGISLKTGEPVPEQKPACPSAPQAAGDAGQPEAFVEIMVIDNDGDQRSVVSRLDTTDIPYHFMRISVTGKEYPVALMVDQLRVEDAIGVLRQLSWDGSIILW